MSKDDGGGQKAEVNWRLISAFCLLPSAFAAAGVIDNFDAPLDWQPRPSDGVTLTITQDPDGHTVAAMRLDFDFHGHAGYAIARKMVSIDFPADYEFSFWIRGNAQPNNLEFKLIDASGDNVWWVDQRDFIFPRDWSRIVLKKRHFQFAWGPLGGGEPHYIAAIEIVVTAGTGGRGTVWIDDLVLSERHVGAVEQPLMFKSLSIDFPEAREFGGLIVESDAHDYDVQTSTDTKAWQTIYSIRGARSARQFLSTPETEARHIRVVPSARKVVVEPLAWSATPTDFFANVARDSPRGDYPRYLHNEQSYWTVVGVDGDTREGLMNDDGAVEPEKGGYSIEPFLYIDRHLVTWDDVRAAQSLASGYLPIPSVKWFSVAAGVSPAGPARTQAPTLTVTAYAAGRREASTLYVDYTIQSDHVTDATLFVAIRPFQVSPSWQFLGVTGGVSPIHEIRYESHTVQVDGRSPVIPLTPPSGFGAATFDEGNIVDWLRCAKIPDRSSASDAHGNASGALAFPLHLEPQSARTVTIAVPLHEKSIASDDMRAPAMHEWEEKLNRVTIQLPPSEQGIIDTIRANVAYILIHRDGAALQPGSRSYERSWIRDGSMISEALLRLGLAEVVREYIDWYVGFQYSDGKVPCCVDTRGADPVPENDSHGELIYLIAEYFRHTHDRALVERVWSHVAAAVNYIDALRHQRMTDQYRNTAFYGLVPKSISHEGYSAKPMHSYWDDFFVAKGLADATFLAEALGYATDQKRFATIRDEFERDLLASIGRSMEMHKIDYIPGSVELGDYDPTSTTIAIAPGGQRSALPALAVARTFDRYFESSRARAADKVAWENYTPYELRAVGTFVRLGQPQRGHELLDFFFRGQRPPEWRQWAEVVWRDSKTPKFIGDMPHGWVGSDYLRSVLDMFAYDREDGALVVGAGIRPEWITQSLGVEVRGMSTHEGLLNFTMRAGQGKVRVHIEGTVDPKNGIVVRSPLGKAAEVTVNHVPADIDFTY